MHEKKTTPRQMEIQKFIIIDGFVVSDYSTATMVVFLVLSLISPVLSPTLGTLLSEYSTNRRSTVGFARHVREFIGSDDIHTRYSPTFSHV